MHRKLLPVFCSAILLVVLAGPAACAVTPLWTEPATAGGQLYGVVISADGSTILTGGDQLISLTRDGRKRWSGWSGSTLDISSQGDYVLTSKGTVLRLISGAGTLVWDKNLEVDVKSVSMAPDLSLIAAAGGGRISTLTFSGQAIASNDTMTINAVRMMPSGTQVLVTTSKDIQLMTPRLTQEWADENLTQNLVAVAPDGSGFVTAFSTRIRQYTANGTILWDKRFPVGDAQALAWSRDGSTIVLAMNENILVLDRSGTQLWMANGTEIENGVAVSDDGNTIAAAGLDKTLRVFNHAGSSLGTFAVRNAIRPNSVGVTGDGQLIVLVAPSAVYGFPRSAFTGSASPAATSATTTEEITEVPTEELPATTPPGPTTRKTPVRTTTIPTPYPKEIPTTPESSPAPAVPLAAILLLLLACHRQRG